MRLLCWLGFHVWIYSRGHGDTRYCSRCGKYQMLDWASGTWWDYGYWGR